MTKRGSIAVTGLVVWLASAQGTLPRANEDSRVVSRDVECPEPGPRENSESGSKESTGDESNDPAKAKGKPVTPGDASNPADGERKKNRLAKEKSPYLLQHAENPVDWYPWGEEAFEKAKKEGKPIFLSIGYSTCHWCHVMEHESFENEKVAAYLNEHFVSVKVDREERPDVDRIYMDVCQMITRRGGWPLSAFLLPDTRAFYAGTYFPPDSFLRVLERIVTVWNTPEDRKQYIDGPAEQIAEQLRGAAKRVVTAVVEPGEESGLDETSSRAAFEWYSRSHDEEWGGFGDAPKFPRSSNLDFLMRYAARTGDAKAIALVDNTLGHMLRGGMYDHLGRGFHRYSVDRFWRVPHFEKMLYDNALIARTLLDAHRLTSNPVYLRVARDTLDYLIERMQHPDGGFYSAEDADTNGREGLTYVWTRREILERLGEERGKVFADYYGVGESGNFLDPHFPESKDLSVLHVTLEGGEAALATQLGRPEAEVSAQLREDRAKLLAIREKRPQPFLDDKVLVEWNGLAISAMAHAFQVSGDDRYLEAGQRAAAFILDRMVVDGELLRRFRDGEVGIPAFLEDHAFLIDGLIDLYESDFDRRWLEAAVRLGKVMVEGFADVDGAFFSSSVEKHEKLIARGKEFYDGAVPSGNSVAFLDLIRLREMTFDPVFVEAVKKFERVAAHQLSATPFAHPQLLCAAEFLLAGPREIVLVGDPADDSTRAMFGSLRSKFLPAKVVLHAKDAKDAEALAKISPLLEFKTAIGGRATAYVCRDRVCDLPAKDVAALEKQLSGD